MQQCAFPGANIEYYAPAVEDMNNPEKVAEAA
jgi:malate dehydrogenase